MKFMHKEIWKDIKGYEGLYQVSNLGRLKSLGQHSAKYCVKKERILKGCLTSKGYVRTVLYNALGKKNFFIHRLVADSFIMNLHNKPFINHKNGIRNDNRVLNLEWVTEKENNLHSFRVLGKKPSKTMLGKFNEKHHNSKKIAAYFLNGKEFKKFPSIMEAARNGYSQGCIAMCLSGVRFHHKNLIWKYV